MDGVLVKWNGTFGEIEVADGDRYMFKKSSENEKYKIGDVVKFNVSSEGKSYFYAVDVEKMF